MVYEVDDEFKGDLARTYFYMVTCYMTSNFTQAEGGRVMFTYSNGTAQLTSYSIDLLLKWHRDDPVSQRELARNEVIYGNPIYNKCSYNQGNRNPFIDYPELAEYIWGTKSTMPVAVAGLVTPYAGGSSEETVVVTVREEERAAQIVIENGQLYILREGAVYTITGVRVK